MDENAREIVSGNENVWRWTGFPARFLFLDARAVFAFPLFLVHISKMTASIVLISTLIFYVLERKKIPFNIAMRMLRFNPFEISPYPIRIRSRTARLAQPHAGRFR